MEFTPNGGGRWLLLPLFMPPMFNSGDSWRDQLMNARVLIAEIVRKSNLTCANDTLLAEIDSWDSLKGVRLVLRLQEIIGRELSEDDIAALRSVADVERVLQGA